jgi:hypothetical protein
MPRAELSRRVDKVVGSPPLCDMGTSSVASSRRRCSTPMASGICPGKWQAAIIAAERNRPQLRVVTGD